MPLHRARAHHRDAPREGAVANIRIPQTWTWVTWPAHRHQTLRIISALPIHSTVELSVPQEWTIPPENHTLQPLRNRLKGHYSPYAKLIQSRTFYLPLEIRTRRSDFDIRMRLTEFFKEHSDIPYQQRLALLTRLPGFCLWASCTNSSAGFLQGWESSIALSLHVHGGINVGELPMERTGRFWWTIDLLASRLRQNTQCIAGAFSGVPFRITLPRLALRLIGNLTSTSEGFRELQQAIQGFLISPYLEEWAVRGLPRGPYGVQKQFVKSVAATALFMAREIMVRIGNDDESDQSLRSALKNIVRNDPYAKVLHLTAEMQGSVVTAAMQRQMALFLTQRTLRPLWAKYQLLSPTELDSNEAYKQFCPPPLRTSIKDILKGPFCTAFTENWTNRLLGPEGQAAIDFDLL